MVPGSPGAPGSEPSPPRPGLCCYFPGFLPQRPWGRSRDVALGPPSFLLMAPQGGGLVWFQEQVNDIPQPVRKMPALPQGLPHAQ